jgi:hypothetical protein
MFRNRRKQDTLPTSMNAAPSIFHYSKNGNAADGSGRAIHMEAPVARAWKKATMYTKGTYYSLGFCVFLMYFGYRWLRWSHGESPPHTFADQRLMHSAPFVLLVHALISLCVVGFLGSSRVFYFAKLLLCFCL